MKLSVQAVSSSSGSYRVDFSDETGVLRVFCHCQAGQLQQVCKHKLALIKGDCSMLYDPVEEKQLREVLASAAYPAIKKRLGEYEQEVAAIEREMARLKKREKDLKPALAHELTHG